MKTATDYLSLALAEQIATHRGEGYTPLSTDEPNTPLVLRETAQRAIDLALVDAERYKTNLVGAVIRSHSPTSQPAEQATPTNV
jgi:hypothetical protein